MSEYGRQVSCGLSTNRKQKERKDKAEPERLVRKRGRYKWGTDSHKEVEYISKKKSVAET